VIELLRVSSTRFLLPVILTALGGIVLLVASVALWFIQSSSDLVQRNQLRDGHLIAEGLANAVAPQLVRKDYGALEGRLLQTAADPSVSSALVIDTQGQVLGYVLGRSVDKPAHPAFDLQTVQPPSAEHMFEEVRPSIFSVWHVVAVGVDVGWVRVEVSADSYAHDMDMIKREVWGLASAVTVAGLFLLGAAIFRSRKLLYLHDVEVEKQQHLLEDKANYDALTHLPNRSLLFDRLTQAIARNVRNQRLLAVCFVDLDEFKPINDRYGHEAGDRVLIEVAQRFQASVRGDDTVARLGGDEFVVLLGEMENTKEAELTVDRLLLSLSEPLIFAGNRIDLQASIGYALFPDDSRDGDVLLHQADQAMYQAKQSGRNCIRKYHPDGLEDLNVMETSVRQIL
jgi:diguanylate cyclase (GGDEF)-like protein